jgi:Ca2+-binding EF-hand superfamily protein
MTITAMDADVVGSNRETTTGRNPQKDMKEGALKMTNGRFVLVTTILIALAVSLPAMAGKQDVQGKGQRMQRLIAADTNGDGRITFDEAKTAFPKLTQERFSRLDRNGDGVLSMEDRRQGGKGKLAQRLKAADTNGDGKLSFEEARAAFPKMTQERFSTMDRNHDGFLSKEDRGGAAN